MTASTPDDIDHPETDQPGTDQPGTDQPGTDQPGTTGHAGVDEVLASLEGVESRPLADHLDVLVAAHEQLHTTLDEFRAREGGDDNTPTASEHP